MVAVLTIADPVEAAIKKADAWIEIATPIIKAYLEADQVHATLHSAALAETGLFQSTLTGAASDIGEAVQSLWAEVEGLRNAFINDNWFHVADNATDAIWDEALAANDRLERETVTCDAAMRRVRDAL